MRKAARALRQQSARDLASHVLLDLVDYWTINPPRIFGRSAPLELEIGAGRGDFIIERAAAMPARDFIAIELARTIARLMALRAARRGLTNLRVLRIDARSAVNLLLPDQSLNACHIYFPDPWPKAHHAKHRLFTPHFACNLSRVLRKGAPLYIASDVPEYAAMIFAILEEAGFTRLAESPPGASQTGFAKKFIEQGRPIFSGAFSIGKDRIPASARA